MSLTQDVERNTMMEMKYDNRIMVTDMNVLFVTQIQGFTFLFLYKIKFDSVPPPNQDNWKSTQCGTTPYTHKLGPLHFPLKLNKNMAVL